MHVELMKRLAGRSGLRKNLGLEFVDDGLWPYLDIQNPIGVARVIGEAKQLHPERQVYLRGQTNHHRAMRPSLLRGVDGDQLQARRRAEKRLAKHIRSIPGRRFRRQNVAALLQHYGFRTSWLDAVDNLFVATWFATHDFQEGNGAFRIVSTPHSHGWLYLIEVDQLRLRSVDLRRKHHPLSTRPHVQHGISLAVKNRATVDLRDFVVATVRFPVTRYTTTGTLFDSSFLLPSRVADHTLRLLLKHGANEMAEDIEASHQLTSGTLGRVSECAAT